MAAISIRTQHLDQLIRTCGSQVDVDKFQEQVMETAELVSELKSSEIDVQLPSSSDTSINDRLIAMASKNALLDETKKIVDAALLTLKQQVQSGSHTYDPAAAVDVPDLESVIRTILEKSAVMAPSSSSSTLISISDEDAVRFNSHDYTKRVKEELQEDMDDDDELRVVNTNTAGNLKSELTCPILQTIMTNPITSKVCKHSFDDSTIREIINKASGKCVKCPISGCGKMLRMGDLSKNGQLERKLKKYKKDLASGKCNEGSGEPMMVI